MKLLTNPIYQDDVKASISKIVACDDLKHKSILVTGASGLIGSAIVDQLLVLNDTYDYDIKIYAGGRQLSKLKERFGPETGSCQFLVYDAEQPFECDIAVDYMIHAASPASPDLYVNQPVETMATNFIGMYHLLNFARDKAVSKVIYVSSSEVYGTGSVVDPIREEFLGQVDHLHVRSSYASSKRATETLCIAFAKEYNLDIMIVRPGHIYGPSAQATDQRVSSFFMSQALAGHDLVMKSSGQQLRSYCHSLDCASAILSVMLAGRSGQAYNISNPTSIITIRQMADFITKIAGVELILDLPMQEEKNQENPMQNASLNSQKLEKLGWTGLFDAETGFAHTYKVLKEFFRANK